MMTLERSTGQPLERRFSSPGAADCASDSTQGTLVVNSKGQRRRSCLTRLQAVLPHPTHSFLTVSVDREEPNGEHACCTAALLPLNRLGRQERSRRADLPDAALRRVAGPLEASGRKPDSTEMPSTPAACVDRRRSCRRWGDSPLRGCGRRAGACRDR